MTPLAIIAVTDLRVMELLAHFSHVVARYVLFLLELPGRVGETTVFAKFAFPKMDHIFAHLSFFLFFYVMVEILAFLVICKGLLQLFACGLTILISSR